jgi:hypothetical protein
MIFITTDKNTNKEAYKEIFDKYENFIFSERTIKKKIKHNSLINTAYIVFSEKEYSRALKMFLDVHNDIVSNRYIVSRNIMASLANNIACCYTKLQEEKKYKDYFLLINAESFFKKAIKYSTAFYRAKGLIIFNYAIFNLKLQIWEEDPIILQKAKNNFSLMNFVNKFVYTKKRSLLMYRLFILCNKYRFFNDITPKITVSLGVRLF